MNFGHEQHCRRSIIEDDIVTTRPHEIPHVNQFLGAGHVFTLTPVDCTRSTSTITARVKLVNEGNYVYPSALSFVPPQRMTTMCLCRRVYSGISINP